MTHHHFTTPSTPSTAEDTADLHDTRDDHEGRDVRDVHDVHDVVARVLSRTGTALASTAAQHEHADGYADGLDDGALEREARAARRRVAGLSTELEDVSEVEYRQVRLEKVVLVGLELPRPHGAAAPGGGALEARDVQDADTSLRELAALAETARRAGLVVTERDRVVAGLREQGWAVPEAQGNFFWLGVGPATTALAEHFRAAGILVRPFAGEGVRVSVGTPGENDRVLAAAATSPLLRRFR